MIDAVTGRAPRNTYRLQITAEFDLFEATRQLPYLHELGVDWVYLSPLLAAEPGSSHGYDVVDTGRIDPSRGGAEGLAALSAEARRLGLGVLVDIVPNHVGVATPWENPWWWDVLQHGRESAHATSFDIDWEYGGGRLRIPVLGDDDLPVDGGPIGHLEIVTAASGQGAELSYHDQRFPVAPGTADDLGRGGVDATAVHARQHYELIGWRRADGELNYRRFFSVNTLAGVRVERSETFAATHTEIGRWFSEGLVDGLRVDHPDGLRDPAGYLDDLARLTDGAYVLVEKILEPGEELPASWATAGTTGYDVLALLDRVLTDPAGQAPLDALEARLRGGEVEWTQLVHDRKRDVADRTLLAETRRIVRELPSFDHDPSVTQDAVAELLACFGVYRSYLPVGRKHLDEALASASKRRPDLAPVLDVLAPVLGDPESAGARRFQQTSGMVMAKGVEDCAFYRYSRLTSLNEVGADPSVFAVSPTDFHEAMAQRQREWPDAMTTLSTHDTKRGEDVRARITVLAELPGLWEGVLDDLLGLVPVPDPGFGSLLWQAVLGVWPALVDGVPPTDLRDRLHAYAEKAMREAGDRTTWTDPDAAYEKAVHAAVDAAIDDDQVRGALSSLAERVAAPGWSNALAAKLVAVTAPGVCDVYQGSELWEQSLVDPDNRRPVDFELRARLLADVDAAAPAWPTALDDDARAKLLVTSAALRLRRDRPELFTGYLPLQASGPASENVLGFSRGGAITVVTRLPVGLAEHGGWDDTSLVLPEGSWTNALAPEDPAGQPASLFGGGQVRVADLLAHLPVALLVKGGLMRPTQRAPFAVWAPTPRRVRLSVADDVVEMTRDPDGWWTPTGPVPDLFAEGPESAEVDYGYLLDDEETPRPDPRSLRQPNGVHARSRRFDLDSFDWSDQGWAGRQLAGSVIYELHVGTFTPEGTLDAAAERLDHLVALGVDLVEVMPVNAFNGTHNWGYDGVLWNCVHEGYGGPEAYQRFVNACHAEGLGVIQDVVYNHLGPSGNYLPLFGPYLRTEGSNSWGSSVNLDGAGSVEVRRYILDNALMWLRDFHVDGLRLDAVHALVDDSAMHLLEELGLEVAALSAHLRRPLTLVAESDLNDARMVTPRAAGGTGLDAQWSDDFHHAVHVALTGETSGYYADFEPLSALAKVCERGFFHDGTWSSFRGRNHGVPVDTATMPTWRLVVCNQNHDQIGNRARGDRFSDPTPGHLDDDQLVCAAMLTLCGPFTPMLFQGEEWAASTPFQFFTSHPEPELGKATAEGRVREFAAMGWDPDVVPDPQDPATFERSRLDWEETSTGRHATVLAAYQRLGELRRSLPDLTDPQFGSVSCTVDEAARVFTIRRGGVLLAVNFGNAAAEVSVGDDLDLVFRTPSRPTLTEGRLTLPPHAGALLNPT